MIVSHRHRFIYFAVPRTATHSVRDALRPYLDKDDWQQENLTSKQRLPIPALAEAGHGHIGVRAIRPHLSDQQWTEYYKFAMVRHPYDRFISVCAFLNRDNSDYSANPIDWMLRALDRSRFRKRLLVRPQAEMLMDDSGDLPLDFIGRYEHLHDALENVVTYIGLQQLTVPHHNRSPHSTEQSLFTPELYARLNDFYRVDFDKFQYSTHQA